VVKLLTLNYKVLHNTFAAVARVGLVPVLALAGLG
jgi:hypothetical protein